MAVFQRNWRLAALISSCSLLAALGFVLAQEQPAVVPKAAALLGPTANARANEEPVAEKAADSPRLSSLPPDFGPLPNGPNPLKGTALGGETLDQDRAAAFARVAAEQELATPQYAPPLPIQVADEVAMITEQLRGVARNLDRVAANDEDEANYERADQLRKTAARLRREARTLRAAH